MQGRAGLGGVRARLSALSILPRLHDYRMTNADGQGAGAAFSVRSPTVEQGCFDYSRMYPAELSFSFHDLFIAPVSNPKIDFCFFGSSV